MAMKNRFKATEVIEALHKTRGTVTIAADLLQCDDTTVRNYMRRYKTVRDVVEHYNEKMVDVAELKFWAAIEHGDPWAVAMALKTKGKNRGYVERTESEISGRGGGAIEVKAFQYGAAIAGVAPRSMEDSESPGNGEGRHDGQTLGENPDVR